MSDEGAISAVEIRLGTVIKDISATWGCYYNACVCRCVYVRQAQMMSRSTKLAIIFVFSSKKMISTLFHNGSRWVASQCVCLCVWLCFCVSLCIHTDLSVTDWVYPPLGWHMCVCERERVGVFVCVDVYLSEQLFQRERISASVIASAIFSTPISFSPPTPPLSLFLIFLWCLFSLWILSSLLLQTSSPALTHRSFLFYIPLIS